MNRDDNDKVVALLLLAGELTKAASWMATVLGFLWLVGQLGG